MGSGPSKPRPGTKFQVIGAGMSRTGTKTFTEALKILLDAPVHDSGAQSMGGPKLVRKRWLEIMRLAGHENTIAEKAKLKWLLAENVEGFCSTTDSPAVALTPELMELYPDAIVIATTREEKGWWKSAQRMESMVHNKWAQWVTWPLPGIGNVAKWLQLYHDMRRFRITKEWNVDSLEKHNELLRQQVPAEKLFFYDCSQGWEPLCQIFGKEIPSVAFPHENSPAMAEKVFWGLVVTGAITWITLALSISFGAYYLQKTFNNFEVFIG